jgi:phosphoribosylformylglycinamidine synthase I|tara:strand:- start:6384 stop:7643 length:1260 start_codon:yes stop_codon:yes gene_type:complete
MKINIGVVQFPGSNTERETCLAVKRAKMHPIEILWNSDLKSIQACHGYIIAGGFSFEDRSRAGVVASLEPIMDVLKNQSEKGKPIFGICNGAQILVESGLVPGTLNNEISVALADNKRIVSGQIIGTGYFNSWANLKLSVPKKSNAFTMHLTEKEVITVPFAHAEGRFIIPSLLLDELKQNRQTVFRYCDSSGETSNEFPINPNGSDYNLAAISNTSGNILAMMPHPERTPFGDKLFSSMKEYIEKEVHFDKAKLSYLSDKKPINHYIKNKNSKTWVVDLIITDNEAVTVQNALQKRGFEVLITKQQHWEIAYLKNAKDVLKLIENTGELFNSNKEYLSKIPSTKNTHSILTRQKEDIFCQKKFDSLTQRFKIENLLELKRGVVWNITIKNAKFESILNDILNTNILHNPLSHECFRIS